MAKSKTARKSSGTTKDKKTTKKEGKKPSKSQTAPKSSELLCDHCQKPMKDIKTKKLHERNCKNKKKDKTKGKKKPAEKKDKDFDSAIRKMRDEFEDQHQGLEDKYQEREEKLHRELGEIKEVLRLEMEHRHKERARIKKEEATLVEDAPRKSVPPNAQPPESAAVQPPEVVQPPTPPPEEVPRAIDRIPVPIPTLPERKVSDQGPIVEVVEVGTIGPKSEEDVSPKTELPREEILNIIREEMEALSLKLKEEEKIEVLPEPDGLRKDVQDLASQLADIKRNIKDISSEKTPKIKSTRFEQEFKRIDRELGKFSERIAEIMDEVGFGESLSVSKIPPTILEIVYQATLDDLTKELEKTAGSQDAEKISRSALEEVRLKTSGSELFKFDGRKIVTDNLAKTIEGDLISAKQIQTTYEELLSRFLENLPHHKAKNFRAMIKVKSQEFAVDRATVLTKDFEKMHKHFESTDHMLAALSAQVSAKHLKIEEEVQEIKEKLLADKADLSDIELLKVKLREREEREAAIMKDMGLLKAEVEMGKELAKSPKKEKKTVKEEEKEPVKDALDPEGILLEAITGGASSKTTLKKKTGLDEKVILGTISKLVEKKKVIEKKVGKYLSYQTPEQAFKEKLDDKVEAEKKTPSKKGKKPPKRPGVGKVEKDEKKKDDTKSRKKKVEKKEKAEDKVKKVTKKKTEKVKPDKKKKEKDKAQPKKKEKKVKETKPEEKVSSVEPVAKPVQKPKKKKEDKKKKPEEEPEKETEGPAKEKEEAVEEAKKITVPSEAKSLEELNEDERKVLEVITESGLTRTGIQSKVKGMKYTSVLRALRVLIDSGYVGIITKGRLTIYQKLKVEKMEKSKKEENKTEVK